MLAILAVGANIANASTPDPEISNLCDRAALLAAQAEDVPLDVLRAISRTETGRAGESGLQPWPWTVNMEGTGRWFTTEDEARAYVFAHFKRGARSFDVGCFQINYKWHGSAFRSIDEMFDPAMNALYAAAFLNDLFREFGNWSDAAGAYHSRTPEYANAYADRFEEVRNRLSPNSATHQSGRNASRRSGTLNRDLTQTLSPRPLVNGGAQTKGSLVPMVRHASAGPRPFIVMK